MVKPWAGLLSLLIGVWTLGPLPADAACTQSQIEVLPRPLVIGPSIPVTWQIAPPCDVIETGLLLGADPSTLEPAGERIYGLRSGYQQVVGVSETGAYWITAYAVDEEGNLIHSAPRLFPVLIPPARLGPSGPRGSHGAPSSYTGTDADFFQPAGEPHFASLRRFDSLSQGQESEAGPFIPDRFAAGVDHLVGSTHPDEVLSGLTQAVTVAGLSFAPAPADVSQQIAALTQNFVIFEHPRPGFYAVGCHLGKTFFLDLGTSSEVSQCFPESRVFRRDFGGLAFAFSDGFGRLESFFFQQSGASSTRTSATYFIPGVSPGSQLLSAKLRLGLFVLGDPAPVRISGKPPERLDNVSCRPFFVDVNVCTAFGTWDFTEEAAGLAGQGGGELTVTADPIPPAFVQDFPPPVLLQSRSALWLGQLDVNYPWSHGGEIGALTLSFQQACPRELMLSVTPSTVRPRIPPGNKIPPELAGVPREATVEAFVKTCPSDRGAPPSVQVTFEVQAPAQGSADAAGHLHDARPPSAKGNFDGRETTGCTAVIDTSGMGSCTVKYQPSEVSGVETIVGTAQGFNEAREKVTVAAPGLVNLAEVLTNFFRLTGGRPGLHTDNHWGTSDTVTNIQLVAFDFFELFNATLGINDLSLTAGGLFDINGTWTPPHDWHRTGTSVDIDRTACVDPGLRGACSQTVSVPRDFIGRRCDVRGGGFLARERTTPPPIHCEFPK